MAEAAVNFVLGKLGEIIVKEGKLLGGVGEQVKWAQRELTNIRCYLSDADSRRRKGDARAENWLNHLRDVAYRIEDAIDIFFVEVEDNRQKDHQKGPSFKEKLKRMWHKPKELHKLAIELGDVKKVLDEIIKSRIDYGIEPLQEQDIDGRDTRMVPSRRATYQGVDETEVVGLDADRNKILELLSDEKIRRRAVITIVGAGGIGKTTLAHMVYKSAMKDFEYHIMLSVSQQLSLTDLLLKMLKKFDSIVPNNTDVGELIMELKDKLGRSKYLIILDDVWEVNLWNQLKNALPDNKNGSRVLMTSRFIDVAKSADPGMPPYELDFLNDKESRDLLLFF
ncbi:hypothetical protein LUZ63_009654 [Rhynchospora breviuscula]|uniref:Uncharacterized protein n=1 Tax=Rhynchospora breviuscula TaxID=2022672 RepID=A0A9Q0CFG1_9POAL|nr:hypothetical protein LUZ63_009654 [Rhynchospora breviuscula]